MNDNIKEMKAIIDQINSITNEMVIKRTMCSKVFLSNNYQDDLNDIMENKDYSIYIKAEMVQDYVIEFFVKLINLYNINDTPYQDIVNDIQYIKEYTVKLKEIFTLGTQLMALSQHNLFFKNVIITHATIGGYLIGLKKLNNTFGNI